MKRLINWGIGLVCVVGAGLVMWGQIPRAISSVNTPLTITRSLCGTEPTFPQTDLVYISCVDYDELRRAAPYIPWPKGTSTQIIIHAQRGDIVEVTLDGETKYHPLMRDAWGRLVALVPFDGTNHQSLSIKVGAWLD